jgi:hypothetical protein
VTPHDDLCASVADRAGWAMDGSKARYQPDNCAWSAQIRPTREPRNHFIRWHVSCCDPTGVARHTLMAHTTGEALRFAETVVANQVIPSQVIASPVADPAVAGRQHKD